MFPHGPILQRDHQAGRGWVWCCGNRRVGCLLGASGIPRLNQNCRFATTCYWLLCLFLKRGPILNHHKSSVQMSYRHMLYAFSAVYIYIYTYLFIHLFICLSSAWLHQTIGEVPKLRRFPRDIPAPCELTCFGPVHDPNGVIPIDTTYTQVCIYSKICYAYFICNISN